MCQPCWMGPRVLIIEDDDDIARGLMYLLGKHCDVERASSLRDGLRHIERGGYTALICDWDLGDGTGLAALRLSAALHPAARRIVYSGRFRDEIDDVLTAEVVDAILLKPCEPTEIITALRISPVIQ
jgi:HTH-type transcriptional regulator, bacterioopsin transcriptional activator and related proteins